MKQYKWNSEMVFDDIKKIKQIYAENNNIQALADLRKVSIMLKNSNCFDKPKRTSYLSDIVDNAIKLYSMDNINVKNENSKDLCNKLEEIKKDNNNNIKIANNIKNHKLKRRKYIKVEKVNFSQAINWSKSTFLNFDLKYHCDFNNFIDNGRIYISDNTEENKHTCVIPLYTINRVFSQINFRKNLFSIDDFLFCFLNSQVCKNKINIKSSKFSKTLEIFFYLIYSDLLKENNYKAHYDIKYNIYDNFKSRLNEFKYITNSSNNLVYNSNNSKFVINRDSSLYDGEMVAMFKRGVSYNRINSSFVNTYSHLLAIYLYQQYNIDKNKTKNDIKLLIENIGILPDDQLLKLLNIDLNILAQCNYLDDFVNKCKYEYTKIKRK